MTLRDDARALGAPPCPPDLIVRVVEDRARGVRAVLPGGDPAVPRPRLRRGVLIAEAAALVIGLVTVSRWPTTPEPVVEAATQGACDMNSETRALLMTGSFLLATACAQEPPSTPYEPAPPVRVLEANQLREGTWVYRVSHRAAGADIAEARERYVQRAVSDGFDARAAAADFDVMMTRLAERFTYETMHVLERVGSGPEAEWLSASSVLVPPAEGPGWQGQSRADTVYYAADGMTPLRQAYHLIRGGKERWALQAVFANDSVHSVSDYRGFGNSPPERRTRSTVFPRDGVPTVLAVHDPALGLFLKQLPLTTAWSGSYRVGPFGDGSFRDQSVVVDGEETVEVPAGVFDCWRLTMPPHDLRIWVAKDGQLVVKSVSGPEGQVHERVLVSASPAR